MQLGIYPARENISKANLTERTQRESLDIHITIRKEHSKDSKTQLNSEVQSQTT